MACYRTALQLRPSFPQALNNLAVVLTAQARAPARFPRPGSLGPNAYGSCPAFHVCHPCALPFERTYCFASLYGCYPLAFTCTCHRSQAQGQLGMHSVCAMGWQGRVSEALALLQAGADSSA